MDINTRLRNHIDTLFGGVAQSVRVQEIKEEMLRNLTEKYYDLITEGRDEETAYSIAISSIGDVSILLEENRAGGDSNMEQQMQKYKARSAVLISVAVMLYILVRHPAHYFQYKQRFNRGHDAWAYPDVRNDCRSDGPAYFQFHDKTEIR